LKGLSSAVQKRRSKRKKKKEKKILETGIVELLFNHITFFFQAAVSGRFAHNRVTRMDEQEQGYFNKYGADDCVRNLL
jgi:hypothetical protein